MDTDRGLAQSDVVYYVHFACERPLNKHAQVCAIDVFSF